MCIDFGSFPTFFANVFLCYVNCANDGHYCPNNRSSWWCKQQVSRVPLLKYHLTDVNVDKKDRFTAVHVSKDRPLKLIGSLSLSLSDPSMGQSPTSCQVSGLSAHADGDGVFVAEFQLEMVKWGSWAWRGYTLKQVSKGSAKAVHFHQNIIRYTSLYHIYVYIWCIYIYSMVYM